MRTLDVVSSKNMREPSAEELAALELVRLAKERGLSLTGPDGLLKQFTKSVLETAPNEEMTEHLGHEKNRAPEDRDSANVRNGTRPKTVLTEATGHVEIDVPRDREGWCGPDASSPPHRKPKALRPHLPVLEAIERQDAAEARSTMEALIGRASRRLRAIVDEQESPILEDTAALAAAAQLRSAP